MVVANLIEMCEKFMKSLSNSDIRMDDYQYLDMYSEYVEMKGRGDKVTYIVAFLSEKYNVSTASVYRIIRRFSRAVKM